MKFDVIIIGSGIGGSAAFAILSSHGFKTLLLEKNPRPGGSCSYYIKDGFQVDWGTHMFSRGHKGPIGRVLKIARSRHSIEFRKKSRLSVGRGFGIGEIVLPGEKWRLPKFFYDLFRKLKVPLREYPNVMRLLYDLAVMDDDEIKKWDEVDVESFMRTYTSDEKVVGFLSFLFGLYFVLPPWEVSAGEAILCYKRMFHDWWLSYPKGGAFAVPAAMIKTGEDYGGRILLNSPVRKIVVKGGRVKGVYVDGKGFIGAKAVISTTSLKDTVFHLTGREYFEEEYLGAIRKIKASKIAVQAKIALKKPIIDAGCLTGGVALREGFDISKYTIEDMKRVYRKIEEGRIPDILPFYCPVPTNFDPSLAPEGMQLITACMVAPTTDIPLKDPPEKWNQVMMKGLEKLLPGLRENLLWVDFLPVKHSEKWIGKTGGPAISTAQCPGQVGERRHPVRLPVKGLYAAGDCAGGRGIGTELAADSAIECSFALISDFKNAIL